MDKSYLELSDGSRFYGKLFGSDSSFASVSGEVVFNTGMVGYPQSLTDPSYKGQILVLTYPLIGNYGVGLREDFESGSIKVSGLIVSDYSKEYSHWSAKKSLSDWLKENNVPELTGIDTRQLTKKLREKGVMLGKIVVKEKDVKLEDPNKRDLVSEVTTGTIKEYRAETGSKEALKILLIDCGCKENIIKSLQERDATVIRIPYDYDFLNDNSLDYDGIILTNGPGDPKMCRDTIYNLKQAIEQNPKPIFGICIGNQILALASGADTYKMKYGHRSQNQPCTMFDEKGKPTKRCFITSQNHGYAVNPKTLRQEWLPWFINANDSTNEGIRHKTKPFFSVQFHPEATPGPVDTAFLFDYFFDEVRKWKQ